MEARALPHSNTSPISSASWRFQKSIRRPFAMSPEDAAFQEALTAEDPVAGAVLAYLSERLDRVEQQFAQKKADIEAQKVEKRNQKDKIQALNRGAEAAALDIQELKGRIEALNEMSETPSDEQQAQDMVSHITQSTCKI